MKIFESNSFRDLFFKWFRSGIPLSLMEKERNSHRPWKEAQNSPPKKIEKNLMNLEEEEKKSKRIQVEKKSETQRRIRTDFSRHGRYRTSGARHRKMGSGGKKKRTQISKKNWKKKKSNSKNDVPIDSRQSLRSRWMETGLKWKRFAYFVMLRYRVILPWKRCRHLRYAIR